jgi:ribonuclease P protein component
LTPPAVSDLPASVPLDRLTVRPQFLAVTRDGRKAGMPGVVVQARPRPAPPPAGDAPPADVIRYGLTASRKVGNAVARNRARRRLRALARALLPVLGRPGTDYVLVARQATVDRPAPALRADVERALQRLARGGSPEDAPGGRARRGRRGAP